MRKVALTIACPHHHILGRQMMNMNLTFLGMAMIGLVSYLLHAGFVVIQRRILWWKSSAQL
jgi:ABC-type nitrate/sulfonate/bicarbonate transport system permease component